MVLYHDGKHNELLNVCHYFSETQPEEKTDFDQFIKIH